MQLNEIVAICAAALGLLIQCILMISMFKSNKKEIKSIFTGKCEVKPPKTNIIYNYEKRIIDIIISLVALISFSPFATVIALLIKLEDHGKITYKRDCVGYKGNTVSYRLFRTMRLSTIEDNPEYFKSQIEKGLDPRITKIGFFLRKTGFDYIPMFLSVLCGNLTLIGLSRIDPHNISESHKKLFQYGKPGILALSMMKKQEGQSIDQETADRIYLQSHRIFSDIQILLYAINNTYITMARNADTQINTKIEQPSVNNVSPSVTNPDPHHTLLVDSSNTTSATAYSPTAESIISESLDSDSSKIQNIDQYMNKLSYLNKAIKDKPNASLFYRRSAVNYKLKQYEDALFDINKAIEMNPKASLYSKRASIYINCGQFHEALDDINKAIAMSPSETVIRKRAALYALIGKHQEALEDLNTAESFISKNTDICFPHNDVKNNLSQR